MTGGGKELGLPGVAHRAEIVGGADDGELVAVIDSRDCAAMIVVERDGDEYRLNLQGRDIDPEELAHLLVTAARQLRANTSPAGENRRMLVATAKAICAADEATLGPHRQQPAPKTPGDPQWTDYLPHARAALTAARNVR